MDKTELRNSIKYKLKSLNSKDLELLNHSLLDNLKNLLESEAIKSLHPKHLFIFLPAFQGEVDLRPLIDAYLTKFSFYAPVLTEDLNMNFYKLTDDYKKTLSLSKFKIPGPPQTEVFNSKKDPLIIILPGLAFDYNRNRLGRGLGCYDRLLASFNNSQIITIGVCYPIQLLPSIPTEAHDRKLDFIVHSQGIICP